MIAASAEVAAVAGALAAAVAAAVAAGALAVAVAVAAAASVAAVAVAAAVRAVTAAGAGIPAAAAAGKQDSICVSSLRARIPVWCGPHFFVALPGSDLKSKHCRNSRSFPQVAFR